MAAPNSVWSEDSRMASSHLFDIRDAIIRQGPLRQTHFLEGNKRPPRELAGTQAYDQKLQSLSLSWDEKYNNNAQPYSPWSNKVNTVCTQYQRSSSSPIISGNLRFDAEVIINSATYIYIYLQVDTSHC